MGVESANHQRNGRYISKAFFRNCMLFVFLSQNYAKLQTWLKILCDRHPKITSVVGTSNDTYEFDPSFLPSMIMIE